MQLLSSYEQYQELKSSQSDWILFKHSERCSISGGACREVYQAIDELGIEDIYQLNVLTTGNLKYMIADDLGIRHESPQVIIFHKGKVKAHASHGTISKGRFAQQLKGWHDTRI